MFAVVIRTSTLNNVKSKVLTVNDRSFAMTFDTAEPVFIIELYLEGVKNEFYST